MDETQYKPTLIIIIYRWRLVIHGGIDGFSRVPVYIHCSNNNRADTVLQLFLSAVEHFGLPSRVRSDKGGENVDVSLWMLEHPLRGPGRGSMIVGRSVHNQRIERLWRDVYTGVLRFYRDLFFYLEDTTLLDSDDDLCLYALHYIYIPRINQHLKEWKDAWINHPLSSANNATPNQLLTSGLQQLSQVNSSVAREFYAADQVSYNQCIEWSS